MMLPAHFPAHCEGTAGDLRRHLQVMADELHQDREQQRLDGREIQGRLDHADSRLSGVASQFPAALEAIERLGEQIDAGQSQFSGHLQQLDHQVAQLGESLVQQSARDQRADETLPALLRELEAPGTVPRPSVIILTHAESEDVLQSRRRYLKGQCPETVQVGEPFSLLVSIVTTGPPRPGLSRSTCRRKAAMCSSWSTLRGCSSLAVSVRAYMCRQTAILSR